MTCFRIAKPEFRSSLLTGDGAFRFGGRWSSRGRAAVYASGNHSLAMLELLLHVDDAERFWRTPHVYVELAVPSVITPPELHNQPEYLNFLLNPLHPRFGTDLDFGPLNDLSWSNRKLES